MTGTPTFFWEGSGTGFKARLSYGNSVIDKRPRRETTGLWPRRGHRVIEIGAVALERGAVGEESEILRALCGESPFFVNLFEKRGQKRDLKKNREVDPMNVNNIK
jgi:hypothetical protein